MAHLGEERYDTILDLLFHLTSTRVGANELWNPLFDTKAPLIAVSNFAISFVFDQPWRHHLRSNVSVTATLAEWNGQLDRGNQVGEGRGLVPAAEGARGCRACSKDGQEGVRDRKWGVAAEKNILYLASAVLYNPGIRLASRCGFIPRYTVHLPTPSRRNQLRFLFPRGVPFLPPFPSPRLHRNSAAVFSFFFSFFRAPPIIAPVQSCNYNIIYTERWSYPWVRERGVNTFSQSRNWQKPWPHRPQFKKIEWNALYDRENWFFYGHLIHFVRVVFFPFFPSRTRNIRSISKNISTFMKKCISIKSW